MTLPVFVLQPLKGVANIKKVMIFALCVLVMYCIYFFTLFGYAHNRIEYIQDVKWKFRDDYIGFNDLTSICIKYDYFIDMDADDLLILVTKNNRYLLESAEGDHYSRIKSEAASFANYSLIVDDIAYILEFVWEDNRLFGEGGDRVLIALNEDKIVIGNSLVK